MADSTVNSASSATLRETSTSFKGKGKVIENATQNRMSNDSLAAAGTEILTATNESSLVGPINEEILDIEDYQGDKERKFENFYRLLTESDIPVERKEELFRLLEETASTSTRRMETNKAFQSHPNFKW